MPRNAPTAALLGALLGMATTAAHPQAGIFADGFESGDVSAWLPFVRLVVIGDTGEGNVAQHCVADAMNARCEAAPGGCTAVVMTGDNFYDNGVTSVDDPQWTTKFEAPYARPALDGLPFFPVLGNHDYTYNFPAPSSGSRDAQIDYTLLPVGVGPGYRASGKWTLPAGWYDVSLGGGLVHLFALDGQRTGGGFPGAQLEDMQSRVAASTGVWKLVAGHFPRFTSGEHRPGLDSYDASTVLSDPPGLFNMLSAIYCGADMYMAGHDHDRELIDRGADPACPDTWFLVSGAGAKTRSSTQPLHPDSLFFDDTVEGFAVLEANFQRLVIEIWDAVPGACETPVPVYRRVVER